MPASSVTWSPSSSGNVEIVADFPAADAAHVAPPANPRASQNCALFDSSDLRGPEHLSGELVGEDEDDRQRWPNCHLALKLPR